MHDPNQGNPADQVRGACLEVNIAAQAGNPACAGQTPVAAPYSGFNGTVAQALRPFPQYSNAQVDSATMSDPFGVYTYNALQVSVTEALFAGTDASGELYLVEEHYECRFGVSIAGCMGRQWNFRAL